MAKKEHYVDALKNQITVGCHLHVQKAGIFHVTEDAQGELVFSPYGKIEKVRDYFSNDLSVVKVVPCHPDSRPAMKFYNSRGEEDKGATEFFNAYMNPNGDSNLTENFGNFLNYECDPADSGLKPNVKIEVFQQDWIPGFAAFQEGSIAHGDHAHVVLNIGSILCAAGLKDVELKDVPYFVAESLMHEIVHVLEEWAGVEFSEKRVEELIKKYNEGINPDTKKTERVDYSGTTFVVDSCSISKKEFFEEQFPGCEVQDDCVVIIDNIEYNIISCEVVGVDMGSLVPYRLV